MKTQACDVETIMDFHRYYRSAWLPMDDKYTINITTTDDARVYYSTKEKNENTMDWTDFKKRTSFGVPQLGMREYGPTVAFFYIRPIRHSLRGFQPHYTVPHNFNSWELRNFIMPRLSSYDVSKEIFFPTFRKTEEALAVLDSGERIGCACSPDVGVYTSYQSAAPLIAFKRYCVGYFENSREINVFPRYQHVGNLIARTLGVRRVA